MVHGELQFLVLVRPAVDFALLWAEKEATHTWCLMAGLERVAVLSHTWSCSRNTWKTGR